MTEHAQRTEQIRASAHGHAVVRFAIQSLAGAEGSAPPPPTFTAALSAKLVALGPTDELLAATLGVVELAYVLRKQGVTGGADALLAALAEAQALVDDALSTLPPNDEALAALRGARFAAFLGDERGPALEKRPPKGDEVAAGPLARMALAHVGSKKDER